jgi:hypothetical protein
MVTERVPVTWLLLLQQPAPSGAAPPGALMSRTAGAALLLHDAEAGRRSAWGLADGCRCGAVRGGRGGGCGVAAPPLDQASPSLLAASVVEVARRARLGLARSGAAGAPAHSALLAGGATVEGGAAASSLTAGPATGVVLAGVARSG